MARIKINDLPKDMKISANELRAIHGGSPLDAFLSIINEQKATLERDMARLYEDFFIESCDPWAVPSIGDPVATRQVSGIRRRY